MRRQVEAWVDGEVTGWAAREVAAHLEQCWGCSGDAELARLVKAALSSFGEGRPPGLADLRLRRWASQLGPLG